MYEGSIFRVSFTTPYRGFVVCLFVTRGPGDSKLLCGPTTKIEGKERCDRQGREKAREAQS